MQRFFEYIGHHPYLAGGALFAAIVVAVYELRERLHGTAAIGTMQAVQLMNQGALVLDVRPRESYEAGHIGEARNLPVADIDGQADGLGRWRDKTVIVYCDSGATGAGAVRALAKHGFGRIFNLEGGINAWIKDNLPVSKTPAGRKPGAK